jgi:predicted Zn finger-like uncharacterized protein
MLVQCPNCKTTYKVSDEVLKGSAPAFRCSRCRHTFELEAETATESAIEQTEETDKQPENPAVDQELSFSFPPKEAAEASSDSGQAPSESSTTAPLNTSGDVSANEQSWSMDSESNHSDEPPFTLPDEPQGAQPANLDVSADPGATAATLNVRPEASQPEGDNILPLSSYMDQQASIGPYLTLFVLLVIGFALIAVISHAHPSSSEEVLRNIPLFGASVLRNSHLKEGILIQSLRGGYQSVQGNREVFVVTGVVVNQNPVVVREIQVTGKVYDQVGKEVEQQTIWIGNSISTKILRGMTTEDIPHLQSLKPLKSFEMPPGDSVPFAMVFLKAAKRAKDFSCGVALAGGEV